MRRFFIFTLGLLMAINAYTQPIQKRIETENFDGTVTFVSTPSTAWEKDANYSLSPPYSYLGMVPNMAGGIITLETPSYNLSAYDYVLLRFNHICKISPQDIVRIEYKLDGMAWKPLSAASVYLGQATFYQTQGFNASSYSVWQGGNLLAVPSKSWWREESFDVSGDVKKDVAVQFRFVIQHGNTPGTQISYGWLLDDITIIASTYEVTPPVVEFRAPLIEGNVYQVGPYDINASVKRKTNAPIETPWLKYTAIQNGITIANDSVKMTSTSGDSLWQATIPEFPRVTEVLYSIRGIDTNGNFKTISSQYYIQPMEAGNYTDNSAAITSIDMQDTVVISANNTASIPIVATVKNMGELNLTSATIYYSVNNNTPQQFIWNGNLAKDASRMDTVGYYYPRFREYDTVLVWISMPNGVTDSIVNDDTVKKYIYGGSDLIMYFYNYLGDTVYLTGPHQVMVYRKSLSGIVVPALSLCVEVTKSGVTVYDTLPMLFDATQDLWIATIPHQKYESKIIYSITETDILGNVISIIDSFYVKKLTASIQGGMVEYAPYGTGMSTNGGIYESDEPTSWTRHLFPASNTGADIQDLFLTSIAWHAGDPVGHVRTNFNIYMQITSLASNPVVYMNPVVERAVLVYKGTMVSVAGWNEIVFDRPFFVPKDSSLLIYIEDKTGYVSPQGGRTIFSMANFSWGDVPGSYYGNIGTYPSIAMRFTSSGWTAMNENNSVALEQINSPATEEVLANVSQAVHVTIRNRGVSNLTSCDINWTLNGTLQQPYHYTGNLLEDVTDTLTLGYYNPSSGTPDNIVIWVSNPNNVIDTYTGDDTLSTTTIVCSSGGLSGNYVIGKSATVNFSSLKRALSILQICGISGKVTFALENGTYPEGIISLAGLTNVMTGKDTFVLTSLSGNAEDVIIQSPDNGIELTKNRNINIQAITVDVCAGIGSAIELLDSCKNILIRDCRLLANPEIKEFGSGITMSYSTGPILGGGIMDSIFIINNLLDGGYYGFNFSGGTGNTARGTNVVFDSNIISNQYNYACRSAYTDFTRFSYNTILSRITVTNPLWYGLYTTSCNGIFTNNKIIQRSDDISRSYGIYLEYNNYYPNPNPDTALVANNEIILSAKEASSCGIYTSSCHSKLLHNSIYVSGIAAARGIYLANSANDIITVKNNNIMMTATNAYPIYINGTSNLSKYDIDYNNMYAPVYVGYAGNNMHSIAEWQQTVTTDLHSTSILPNIADPTNSLEPLHSFGLLCDALVSEDIRGKTRAAKATIGCYEVSPPTGNGALITIIGLREGAVLGQTDPIKVEIANTGLTQITAANLGWSVNGVIQNSSLNFPVSLLNGQSDTVSLGTLTYSAGKITVKVWVNNFNGGSLSDAIVEDDTLTASVVICNNNYSGQLTIGATGDFSTIEEAYAALALCGVNGDITLAFESGRHTGSLNLTNSSTLYGTYSLTLTSVSGNPADAIFATPFGTVILCNNTDNLIVRDITLDATKGTCGIQFTGAASNITVDNCHILANPTATSSSYAGIHKATNTGALNNLTITNCKIDGGYYGVYVYGTSSVYCQNVFIDSNIVTNQYYYGIYCYYVAGKTISYNRISPRLSNSNTSWSGLYGYYLRNSSVNIIGNRISATNINITSTAQGMYLYYVDTALVANNEIHISGNASTTNGLYVYYPRKVNVINNTVYTFKIGTGGTNYAHYNYLASGYSSTVRNNIFIAIGGTTSYAFYFNASASNFPSYKAYYDIDYNNYYSTGNLGYVTGSAKADLSAWQTAVSPLDSHSISLDPLFTDPNVDLTLSSHLDTLVCPRWQDVGIDIEDAPRPPITSMGARTNFSEGNDLKLTQFFEWNNDVIPNQTASVNVVMANSGTLSITDATLNWSVNGILQTTVSWNANPSLGSSQQDTVYIGSFPVSENVVDYDIVVWIDSINGQPDAVKWNNTVKTSAELKPLAEFVAPFVPDTITRLSFEVNTLIRSWGGATTVSPKMIFASINGNVTTYDSVLMTPRGNNIWQAVIPPQYYGSKVIYSLSLTDTVGNAIMLIDSTYIHDATFIFGDTASLSLSLVEPLNTTICIPDYTPVSIVLTNDGMIDYNFFRDTIFLELEIVTPEQTKHTVSLPFTGMIDAESSVTVQLMPSFPIFRLGAYDIKVWINNPKVNAIYTDTINYTYLSNKIGLPIDEDFSNGIPSELDVWGNNTSATWTVTGADAIVEPFFGDSMLSFTGNKGAMCSFSTRHMNLSRAIQPSLSFWYFHDTVVSKDYTDVRISVDGGTSYNELLSITKYNPTYGWKQYNINLSPYAVNECVVFIFEAMEKSNGTVTQYIDRIRITAQQDIGVSEIIIPELTVCDLQNKDLKIVLENQSAPVLNYAATPAIVSLEIMETREIFTDTIKSGFIDRFAVDTVMIAKNFNFDKGTYTFKITFSSELDTNRKNDTLVRTLHVNPVLEAAIRHESGETTMCLAGEIIVKQSVMLYNKGNMDLSDIDMVFQMDTGVNFDIYTTFKETCTQTILVGDSFAYTFNTAYTVPWNTNYYVGVVATLSCDSTLANDKDNIMECVDMDDLYMVNIDNPSTGRDIVGSVVYARATLTNRHDLKDYPNGVNITLIVKNSQGEEIKKFTETTEAIGILATLSHTFTNSYTVPNDAEYYLTVYIDHSDSYPYNDTMTVERHTEEVGIESAGKINVFTLAQNIPNPATNSTRIDYSVPEAGEVIFHVHSISGQLLYSKTIDTKRGTNSMELNTSTFAAGVYFYSMEYKGQRLVRQLIINN
ncbi:MAG: T9SS type A sorting domain-containing protein [Bacteroidales bacterium]|jgi:hypothetical protein|nr:T9SS type A sorting domain-containing protein [Bacteroidales bacterium]